MYPLGKVFFPPSPRPYCRSTWRRAHDLLSQREFAPSLPQHPFTPASTPAHHLISAEFSRCITAKSLASQPDSLERVPVSPCWPPCGRNARCVVCQYSTALISVFSSTVKPCAYICNVPTPAASSRAFVCPPLLSWCYAGCGRRAQPRRFGGC